MDGYMVEYNNGEEQRLKKIRSAYSRMGLAYLVFFVTAAVCQVAAMAALAGVRDVIGDGLYALLGLLSMYPVAFPLCCLVAHTVPRRGPSWQFPVGGGRFAAIFVICLGAMLVGNLIGQLLMLVVSLLTGQPMVNNVQELILDMDPWSILVAAVIIAPILEEMMFRKFLLDRVACYGQLTAVLMSGGLFALAHGNFYQFFYAFALGIIFAYVYLRTGRIRYTIALHMLVNFSGSIVPILILRCIERNMMLGSVLMLVWYIVLFSSVIGGIVLLIVGRKQIWFYRMPRKVPAGRWLMTVCVNVGVILFVGYSLVSFLLS